jgi:2-hydroxy-6-oxonona-2,4-dienedioate hydrolase
MTGRRLDEFERHRRVEASAERIVVERDGRGTVWRRWGKGFPTILHHGGSGSWSHWTRNIEALAAGRMVLVPDSPGCGESDLPMEQTAEGIARSLWRDLDELAGLDAEVGLVGFSYGGGIIGTMTALKPARVRQFILVGSGGLGLRRPGRMPLIRWRGLDEADRAEAHRKNLAVLMIAKPENIDDLAVALQGLNAPACRIDTPSITRSVHLELSLVGNRVPVSGIWGALDATVDGGFSRHEALLKRFDPGSELVVIPDVGHWVQYEGADTFNPTLLNLLDRQRRWGEVTAPYQA